MNWYLQTLRKYAEFSRKARRTEYWIFALFNMIFVILVMIIDNVIGTILPELPYGSFCFLYAIAVLIPGLAVAVRCLHDVGKSGRMILIAIIPIMVAIWSFVYWSQKVNEYGANPKVIA